MALTSIEHTLLKIERKLHTMDQNVSVLVADVVQLKVDVKDVADRVAALAAKQAAAIDAEDLTAIQALHGDLAAVHSSLVTIAAP